MMTTEGTEDQALVSGSSELETPRKSICKFLHGLFLWDDTSLS